MRAEILRIHRSVTATAVYVTHDQVEALTMGDRIAVMHDGVIQQVGTPDELYDRPVNRFVAGFIGTPAMGFLTCEVSGNGRPPELRRDGARIKLPAERIGALAGGEVVVGIRPERLELVPPDAAGDARSTLQGVVTVVEPLGSDQHVLVDVGGEPITARVSRDHHVNVGERVTLATDGAHVHLFDPRTGAAHR
jgi:multiple sugar transport system ATP-binding protein